MRKDKIITSRSVYIPDSVYKEISAIAEREHRTVPKQLRVIFEEWKKKLDT